MLAMLVELQGLSVNVVAGAAINTNIAIAGIATADTLLAVIQFDISTGTVVDVIDRKSEASITSAGNIQLTTTNTTGDKLLVAWFNKS